jgi:hypothetical protein
MTRPQLTFFCELEGNVLQALFALPDMVLLGEMGASISLGILDTSPERAEVVRRLNDAGIPVIAWLLLPKEQGYWFNLQNCSEAVQCYERFKAWTDENHISWAGVGLDIEPDITLVQDLAGFPANWSHLIPRLARRALDFGKIRRPRQIYRELVDRIHADGYAVESYQFPLVVDERKAGSTFIQQMIGTFDLPVDKEVLMIYSSFLRPFGPGILWSYGPQADALALGSTGGGVDFGQVHGRLNTTPLSWEEFSRDLRLAWVFSNDLYVFSLEGCVRQGFLSRMQHLEEWDQPFLEPLKMASRVNLWRGVLRPVLWVLAHPLEAGLGAAAISSLFFLLFWLGRRRKAYGI